MKIDEQKWLAAITKAAKDTKALPSSGVVCAIATLRYVRDEMLDGTNEDDSLLITDFFNGEDGLIKAVINAKQLKGFASNASAAAKAAGLESASVELIGLDS